jgi:hypothetical protein
MWIRLRAGLFLVLLTLAGCATPTPAPPTPPSSLAPVTSSEITTPPPPTPPTPPPPPVSYPTHGSGTYTVVPGEGPVLGSTGPLLRFQVAVEVGIVNFDATAAAAFVEDTFADPRGWTAGGQWRLQRVGPGHAADFTVYFVTPGTRDDVCAGPRDLYTNCRNGARVVINMDRWMLGVPHITTPLDEYRHYIINHETGHRLGFGHELCPGPGQPAPVMQQQTLGLHECVPNAWPYVDSHSYHGSSGEYHDPIPAA